jgi:6-pyruvoyl-tetrahydropterin synthase
LIKHGKKLVNTAHGHQYNCEIDYQEERQSKAVVNMNWLRGTASLSELINA